MATSPRSTGEIEVHSLAYTKGDLDKAPSDERMFYIMAGSVANDLAILHKALLAAKDTQSFGNAIAKQGNSVVTGFILRMLSGRLVEAWKLTRSNKELISESYHHDLTSDAQKAYSSICEYFTNGSLLTKVRNKLGFHHDRDLVEQAYASLDAYDELGDYMNVFSGNTLFYTVEIMHIEVLKKLSGLDAEEAIPLWLDDALDQSKNFLSFLGGWALVFVNRHLPSAMGSLIAECETVPAIDLRAMALPFFTLPPSTGS